MIAQIPAFIGGDLCIDAFVSANGIIENYS